MNVKKIEKEKLRKHLYKKGLFLTTVREVIFNEVLVRHGHFTAEELCKAIKSKSKEVSRASVYRVIKELLEANVIRETAFGEKHKHYEHTYDEEHHHHARCIRCQETVEFPCESCDKNYQSFLTQAGFKVLGHELHFYGLCKECK